MTAVANAAFADSEELIVELCRTPFFGSPPGASSIGSSAPTWDAADRDADTLHDSRHLSASVDPSTATVAIDGVFDPLGGEVFKTELDRHL